jgi:Holliday junction resolvase-like predicted endonuclease
MFARLIFAAVNFAARNGLAESRQESTSTTKELARRTGIKGETFAYRCLCRHGYALVARNFTVPGIKGEVDLIGYDGRALAFVEVKTRSAQGGGAKSTPEDAVNADKCRNLRAWRASFSAPADAIRRVAASLFWRSNRTPARSRWCGSTNPPSACLRIHTAFRQAASSRPRVTIARDFPQVPVLLGRRAVAL